MLFAIFLLGAGGAVPGAQAAAECPGNPDAIGTSRVLAVSSAELPKVGREQYPRSLGLADREVVLTFDDGPMRPHTAKVLDTLAAECVKATFFVVGAMATHSPDLVRRAFDEGHTIGTHTQTHPHLARLPEAKAKADIDRGIAATRAALGQARPPAPFFRAPYLQTTPAVEAYVAERGAMLWSIDFHVSDWDMVTPEAVVARVLDRLEHHRKGILLLHDIHRRTALALPKLLAALKKRGYRIVHVVPRPRESAGVLPN